MQSPESGSRMPPLADRLHLPLEGATVEDGHEGSNDGDIPCPGAHAFDQDLETGLDTQVGCPWQAYPASRKHQMRQHVVIRRESYVAGTRDRPEVGIFTQTHTTRPPVPWD